MKMQDFWHQQASSGTWAGYYDGPLDVRSYNFFTRRTAVVRLLESDGKFARILDVGCGTGDYVEVADQHQGSFFGIDYALGMIKDAVRRIPGHGKKHLFVVGTGDELPYRDDTFDLVMAMGYIEYFKDPDAAMREIRRVMKPGATLVLQSFKKDFCGDVDRFVVDPIKAVLRPIRLALGQKLGPSRPNLPDTWIDIKYSKGQLDRLVARHGYRPVAWAYNNFHVFPSFLLRRFPRAYIQLSERIQRRCARFCGPLAVNYIGKYVLDKPAADGRPGARA